MESLQLKNLPEATLSKLKLYKKLLGVKNPPEIPFWDIVVLSSGDEEQRKSYEQQIEVKKSRHEIPSFIKYMVTQDPPGAKIGNGGATMHVLEWLREQLPEEEMIRAKVMLIHAGGYSQRLPNVSVIGKAFMALPCGDPMLTMLEALLMMYIDFPARMDSGVFLTASDIIFLYNGVGEWDVKQPGITAIAHPASLKVATTHGVFVLQEMEEIVQRYRKNPEVPSTMGVVRSFLHKVSKERMIAAGAKIPDKEQVYVDIGYYFDWPTADKLVQFYSQHKPLTCEIDAYGDFLQALGSEAVPDYCTNSANVTFVTDDLVVMRKKVFDHMQGTEMRAVIFNQAQFDHVGTTAEYLHHFFSNPTLSEAYGFQAETMVAAESGLQNSEINSSSNSKRIKLSYEGCRLMHSVLRDRSSTVIGGESVVEYCTIEPRVAIGDKCMLSNLHLPEGVAIADGSFLHTVPVCVDEGVAYTTFAFDVFDSMKSSVSKEHVGKLKYCKKDMAEVCEILYDGVELGTILPDASPKYSLWHCGLFPTFPTRKESAACAINTINKLKGKGSSKFTVPLGRLLSMADILKTKSMAAVLDYHETLRKQIIH